ncbi:MAG: RsiV family protein [Firmicutes bacterium]|nr:RsiV family protein [Bacillota bacterium]
MKKLEELKKEYESLHAPEEGKERVEEAIERAHAENRKNRRIRRMKRCGAGIATAAALFILLPNISSSAAYAMSSMPVLGPIVEAVTFREYAAESEDGRFEADVKIPQLNASDGLPVDPEQLKQINDEIRTICDGMIADFENNMDSGEGYEQLVIQYDILDTTDDYFSIKLITYMVAGSGFEKDYYYTLNLKTGKQMHLSDLFPEGADYIGPISENIQEQMRARMKADENVIYWVETEDGSGAEDTPDELYFREIPADQQFYIDGEGHLVITFSEGDVAPVYMGCDQFIIPDSVVKNIK